MYIAILMLCTCIIYDTYVIIYYILYCSVIYIIYYII